MASVEYEARPALSSISPSLLASAESVVPTTGALARLLAATADPDMSFQSLAQIVRADAALSARVIRLANSAYYGMGGHIKDAQTAISVVGLVNLRSLALVSATNASHLRPVDGFATITGFHAAAAARLSRRLDVREPDAFSLGLLCEIGAAFLSHASSAKFQLSRHEDVGATLTAERRLFGHDHAELAAAVLLAWEFPVDFCAAIASHHSPTPATTPTGRLLQATSALYHSRFDELEGIGLSAEVAGQLRQEVAEDRDNLLAALI